MANDVAVVKGHLVLKVSEASGKNKSEQYVWDYPDGFEAWVKGIVETIAMFSLLLMLSNLPCCHAVEIRGGPRNVKVQQLCIKVASSRIKLNNCAG
jgi:hypothetical protein